MRSLPEASGTVPEAAEVGRKVGRGPIRQQVNLSTNIAQTST